MKLMNYILLAAAISAQAIGAYRFLKKTLSFRSYAYRFTLIPFWIFTLAMVPLFGVRLSPISTILLAVYILAGTTLLTFLIVQYSEKKQQS
jgi:hypothetical protein